MLLSWEHLVWIVYQKLVRKEILNSLAYSEVCVWLSINNNLFWSIEDQTHFDILCWLKAWRSLSNFWRQVHLMGLTSAIHVIMLEWSGKVHIYTNLKTFHPTCMYIRINCDWNILGYELPPNEPKGVGLSKLKGPHSITFNKKGNCPSHISLPWRRRASQHATQIKGVHVHKIVRSM